MGWDFRYLPEHGVVSVKTSGDLDYDATIEFIAAAAAEMQRQGCDRILVDHRDAVLKLSPTRVYRLPAVEVAHGLDQRSKVAVVLSPSTARAEDARNYADVMRHNGLPHRLFADPDAALAWLVDPGSDGPS
jgi:rhamnose utilization protein RhaD (predicted bifunctional aldolase and dehydrogenase)